ncbi:MAG: GDSL-type esterase/lipase family protein [Bryobacterales bacterium]|nr:GDSL-type esterase/lipase family protein [Bryobacterales bacterium]
MERRLLPIAIATAGAALGLVAALPGTAQAPQSRALQPPPARPSDPGRWEESIRSFEESDSKNPPREGGVVFFGSSSFRRWDLEKWFPGRGLINRGFGGSQMADAIRYVDRVILPLKPRTVFLYEGDNDTGNGKTPETVEREFRQLVAIIHGALPRARIVFVSIKPSIRRWHLIDEARAANARIRAICDEDDLLEYVDAATPLLGDDGKPRADLFVEDELHLNDAGYAIWAERIAPYLD